MSSYKIVFLRTLTGSIVLIGKGKFHKKSNKRDALFILLSGIARHRNYSVCGRQTGRDLL